MELPNASLALLEFDRRTSLFDYFLPQFQVRVASRLRDDSVSTAAGSDSKAPSAVVDRFLRPSPGGVDLSPMIVGSSVTYGYAWAKGRGERHTLQPPWGFKVLLPFTLCCPGSGAHMLVAPPPCSAA